MKIPLWNIYINILFLLSQTGCSNSQQHDPHPVTDSSGHEIPRWNRPSGSPLSPDNRQNSNRPRKPCDSHPCQNSGTCVETGDVNKPFVCECRIVYLGERCEVVVKPPAKLKAETIGPDHIKVAWLPPNATRKIQGYIVQHNKFGERRINQSHQIPAGTVQYAIEGLEEGTEYVICINTIFDNETIPTQAVLRDQCIEIRTGGGTMMSSESLILVIVIGAVVIVTLLLLLILLLCCNRRRNDDEKPEGGAFPSASWRRTRESGSYQDRSYLTDMDSEARYTNEDLYNQNQTNNASRSSFNQDDVFQKRQSAEHKPQHLNSHLLAVRSVSVTDHSSAVLNPLRAEARSHSSSSAHIAHKQANRLSNVLSANFRELPPSISNHMMRSPTSRDKDATDEFDIGGSYFAPKHS